MKLKIEFFHDVICSFCYPMSYRMRQLAQDMPQLEIIHRSFALAQDTAALSEMFGSHEQAKDEILTHWVHANKNDDLHRFNIEGMRKESFLFPTSMNGLRAAKAALLAGNELLYWDVFDALQRALFTDHKNIAEEAVIIEVVRSCEIDFDRWNHFYQSAEVHQAVLSDLELASQYGIHSVPSLVIEGKYLIQGAQSYEQLLTQLHQILDEKQLEMIQKPVSLLVDETADAACNLADGKWRCD